VSGIRRPSVRTTMIACDPKIVEKLPVVGNVSDVGGER
jgi:hypothetical protein